MKKITLFAGSFALMSVGLFAQNQAPVNVAPAATNQTDAGIKPNRCGTQPPSAEWDSQFNQMVEAYKQQNTVNGKVAANSYTIPIIFHVIYGSEAKGTYPNLSQAQINSQINVLNADYLGAGYNTNQYAAMKLNNHAAFYDYAVASALPAPDNKGVVIANSGITFCLAAKNPQGGTLAEPGIDRVSYTAKGWGDPAAQSSASSFQSFIDGTIKPGTIWDPTKYFNVWLTDCASSVGLLGYATFPTGTTLAGLGGGATSTTDGVWVFANSCGDMGTVSAPYDKGRTLTHESGHYFGLRHIWGDGSCVSDYCNDTPPATAANYVNWPTTYPYNTGTCTGNSANGEMFMNFMDYSGDAAMWMFTTDQVVRMQTALAQCTDRKSLTTSSASVCTNFATGVQEQTLADGINLYPNPSNGQIFFDVNLSSASDLYFTVSNTLGQVVATKMESNVSNGQLGFDLSQLGKGVYFVSILDNHSTRTVKKFVIQ
jgi:hypothetical protein